MLTNYAKCLPEILRHEGGWADHPSDPGGATMKGITIGTYRQWKGRAVTKAELRAISDEEIAAIYKRNYWDKVRGDDLPAGLDLVAFDAAVNSGPARGARWLQTALGVAADGKIGPKTIAAAEAADAATAINRALDVRLSFLKGLKTWPTFGKGWGRRVSDVRKVALGMAHVKETPVSATRPAPHVNAEAQKRPAQPQVAPQVSAPAKGGHGLAGAAVGALLAFGGYAAAKWSEVTQAWTGFWVYVFSLFN